ncbi:MAG: SDR family NAD(P)-dependent oxidoreductase [Friedmanniella sp.]
MSRLQPFVFAGATAVVTGAASGMGEQLVHQLAGRGCRAVVMVDRDGPRLAAVATAVRAAWHGTTVDEIVADLADTEAIGPLAARITADHPQVTLLVNNAGVGLAGRFDQVTLEEFDWVTRINFVAPVTLTHHLLPALLASPGSHIVNLSSLYGLISPAGQTAYSASKFAIRGFSQALGAELLDRGVGVTTVHPGGIRTRIAESARIGSGVPPEQGTAGIKAAAAVLTYPAGKAAEEILAAVEQRRPRLLIAWSAKIPDVVARLLPVGHVRLMAWLTKRLMR